MNFSAETINLYIKENRFEELIALSEKRHENQFDDLLDLINKANLCIGRGKDVVEAVLVTGPSSSGKTTFSHLLADMLKEDGYRTTVISFDNYYKDREDIQKMHRARGFVPTGDKDYDYETIEAFDVAFFKEQMNEYLAGNEIVLPEYDFASGTRRFNDNVLRPAKRDMLIIEGIHALNPLLRSGLGFNCAFNVYICPFDFFGADSNEKVVRPQELRFMRRAVRDLASRGASIERTMEMWPNVRLGEEKYIKPMKAYADFFFNSSLEYEISYLKKKIFDMRGLLEEGVKKKLDGFIPIETLEYFDGFEDFKCPEKSIFTEFYKA